MAGSARVTSVLAFAEKILRVLFADAAVLAGVGVAAVRHAARVDDDVLVHDLLQLTVFPCRFHGAPDRLAIVRDRGLAAVDTGRQRELRKF